jgi:NAD(P)-dependent dehydrogenase (short-subunit alcohol dehydrogenase family)
MRWGKKAKELGMNVVLSDVRQEPLSKAIRTLRMEKGNGRVEGFICDVTSEESLHALLKSTTTAFPGKSIQFIGANAGVIFTGSTILSGTEKEWQTTYNVNVIGAAYVTHICSTYGKCNVIR